MGSLEYYPTAFASSFLKCAFIDRKIPSLQWNSTMSCDCRGHRCCFLHDCQMAVFGAVGVAIVATLGSVSVRADHVRDLQKAAEQTEDADWGRWGKDDSKYSSWTSHSNRLVPIYTFGIELTDYIGDNSCYRDSSHVETLYGQVPPGVVNSTAQYMDQTDVYRLQRDALAQGKKHIILIVFDGMDWQTTQAAALYKTKRSYDRGRGSGLFFQDYDGAITDYGYFVSSPHNTGTDVDVNAQRVTNPEGDQRGGYDASIGGATPWAQPRSHDYLLGKLRRAHHAVTDSASSATSMTSGIKTYNAAINVDHEGQHVVPIARQLQLERGFAVGVVSSVPISHATPAAAYANNVTRNDYQDLTRDMLGIRSISHRRKALPGLDVLLGGGWGEVKIIDRTKEKKEGETDERDKQGSNYVDGNKYLVTADARSIDYRHGGKYVVVQRTKGKNGRTVLLQAARKAHGADRRLFGFFGAGGGNLPYQTADGQHDPYGKEYTPADIKENPTLADMTRAALGMLSKNENGFWLMIESGDVDWANHDNNIDNSIGSVLSGDDAFRTVVGWVESNKAWDSTAVILTADHGHYFRLLQPDVLMGK